MLDDLLGPLGLLGNLEQALQRKSVWQQGGKVVVEVREKSRMTRNPFGLSPQTTLLPPSGSIVGLGLLSQSRARREV